MKILILNQFNSDNIGDKLIGEVLFNKLQNQGFEVMLGGFAQMSPQKITYSEKRNGFNDWIKRKCPAWLKYNLLYKNRIIQESVRCHLKEMNAVVIGGGQLIKHGTVFPYCFNKWAELAYENNIPFYVYGVGVDDNLGEKDILLYKKGLLYAKSISCRDKQSSKKLEKITSREIYTFPDIVFSMGSMYQIKSNNNIIFMPYSYKVAHDHFKSLKSRDDYYNYMLNTIKSEKYNQLILSAMTSDDLAECHILGDFLKKNDIAYQIVEIQDFKDLIDLYAKAKKLYSGRMHSLIVALLCGLECYPLEISNKIKDFKDNYIKNGEKIDNIISQANEGIERLIKELETNVF